MRRLLANWMRRQADRFDPPAQTNWTFTFANNNVANPQRYGTWTSQTNAAANPLQSTWKWL